MTGIIMHINMNNDIKLGMGKMKYALNHKWKFERWELAFFSGFCQMVIVIFVTLICYSLIIFNDDIISILQDFLAVEVISKLAFYFY